MSGRPPGIFRDPHQPLRARIDDLLGRLTPAEKIALLHQHQAGVPRLGIGRFHTGTEALHGLAWLGPATVFPQTVGLASTWDPELITRVGAAVGEETRGLHHQDPQRVSLNVWAPVVNPLRDPRWGRNEEGYAEDPWLTGELATAYATGLRGDHPFYLRTAPTLKHFLGYNNETDRSTTSSNLPPRVLHEYELPAFRAPVAAGAAVAVMASYNLVNGRPAHLSPLIEQELRRWSDDDVMVVGDAGAASNVAGSQAYHPDDVTGYAAVLRAGIDCVTEGDANSQATIETFTRALDLGLVGMSHVDAAVRHILSVRFRLGEFDPTEGNPFAATTAEVINCPAHQRLAREAARRSIVLLRNDDTALLPLDADRVRRIAVLGPLADTVHTDWYSGTLPYAVTARDGLAARLGAAAITFHEAIDRIVLRTGAGTVVAGEKPDGGPLRVIGAAARPGPHADDHLFDVFDWGDDVIALRAACNGRHVGVDHSGRLVNDQPGPNGWEVRETFRPVPLPDGRTALRHLQSGRLVALGADGVLRADATGVDAAAHFTVELVTDGVHAAADLAHHADVAIVVVGNHPMVNGRETQDRVDLRLPDGHQELIRAVHAANPRTVLVVTSGYPYGLGGADERLPAVLWSAHGGQEFGNALADVLLGADADGQPVDPVGRLTQTWYQSAAELPDLLDYDIIAADATYLYHRGTALYPFGHGLSYTRFTHHDLRLSADSVGPDGTVEVSVDVVNTGGRAGEEVVQLYTRQRRSRVKQPLRQLRGFRRVRLAPGERITVTLPLRATDLAFWDVTQGRPVVEAARHSVQIGRSCTDLTLTATLRVDGEHIPPRDVTTAPVRAVDHDEQHGVDPVTGHQRLGDAVAATQDGAWIAFAGVDLGERTAAVEIFAGTVRPGTLVLRLDDPWDGPLLATVAIPATGAHALLPVRAGTSAASGIHDLFLVLDAGLTVGSFQLHARDEKTARND